MSKGLEASVKKVREEKIPVKRLISNNWFMVRYAAGYDKKLVLSVIGLFCLLQVLEALYDTVLLKIIIEMLQGSGTLQELLLILLVSICERHNL